MQIQLNGEDHPLDEPLSVAGLLAQLAMDRQPVLVELNGKALTKREFEDETVTDGAVVEIIRIVAGG